MWQSTVLAGEGLRQYSADFSPLLEDLFVERISEIVIKEFEDRLKSLDCRFVEGPPVELGQKYDLNKTLVLNTLIDLINQIRLCPDCAKLGEEIVKAIDRQNKLTDEIKSFAKGLI